MTQVRQRLRQALGRHIGQALTPEVCAAIEASVCNVGVPVDLSALEPLAYGDYVISAERFSEVLPELDALHRVHWLETEKHRHGLPFAPDYEAMAEAEQQGRLVQFTVRELAEMRLVGNLRMYLATSRHTGTLFAQEDTLFILPEHRGGFLSINLLRYAERVLFDRLGAREIRADSKLVNSADVLMRRMGYTAVSTGFVKIFQPKGQPT
jgi:hypothetical protein